MQRRYAEEVPDLSPLTRVAAGTAGAAALGLGYATLIERNAFTLREVTVPVLAPGASTLRVLHISDLHMMPGQKRKQNWLRELDRLEPDLVINTGDNIASADALDPLVSTLGRLLDVPGVFVFGSNDYTSPVFRNPLGYLVGRKPPENKAPELPWQRMRDEFTSHAWVDINHQRAQLQIAGLRFDFRGTDDAHLERDDYQLVAGPADPQAAVSVGVTHAPYRRMLDAMTADGVELIFAGHTHGGQVCLPGLGAIITNCDLPTSQAKGLSTHTVGERTSWLHVSAGVGSSPFAPYRFACRPEASLVTLVARPT